MKRVVLTGASGFIGANVARRLLREGHEVHLFLRPDHSPWRVEGIREDVHVHDVDLTDDERLRATLRAIRPDWIFHLAAHGAYSTQTDIRRMVVTNVLGTINLVEAALGSGFQSFVNTGSSSEYGFKDHGPSETEWLEPNSAYAVTKAAATHYCRHVARAHGVRITTLRLYSVYGPFEEPTRLIPTLAMHGLEGRLPPLVNPDVARDYVYAEDVSEAYLHAASAQHVEPGQVYNVGSGVQTTLREAVAAVRRVLAIRAEPSWGSMPNRAWDTSVWVADSRRIERDLSWQARCDFEKGFRLTVEWLRANPALRAHYAAALRRSSPFDRRA